MNKTYTQPGKEGIMEIIKLESDSEDAQTVEKNRNSERGICYGFHTMISILS